MAFIDQVQDLTSLTASDTDELSQFLKDGVIDVTNRWLAIKPQDVTLFGRETSISDSQGVSVGGAKIISVMREAGADGSSDGSTAWEPCKEISSSMQSRVVDVNSLSYASAFNPVYAINSDKTINVYPVPSSNNGFKVFYVNEEPRDISNNAALIHSHSNIKYFPNDKVYLVVIYAGMKLLQATMGNNIISITSVPPDSPSLSTITFSETTGLSISATTPTAISLSTVSYSDSTTVATVDKADMSGNVPAYTKPTMVSRVDFQSYWVAADFGDSDPGALSITAVPPDAPAIASISYSAAGNSDAEVTNITTASASETALIDVSSNAPTYTAPSITSAGGGTDVLDIISGAPDNDTDQIDFSKWWDVLSDYIENEEDSELAASQAQKISTYLNAYQLDMQNKLNTFNKDNTRYQMEFQEAVTKENHDLQIAIANTNNLAQEYRQEAQQATEIDKFNKSQDQALNLANAAKAMEDDIADNNSKVQKFSAEIQAYQAEVGQQIQEYGQKLQRYQTELNTIYQAWAKIESDSLQQFQLDIQDELNEFNKENVRYQANVQAEVAKHNSDLQKALTQAQLDSQDSAKTLEAAIQDNNRKVAQFSAEAQHYATQVNEGVQSYSSQLQRDIQQTQADIASNQHLITKYQAEIASYQAEITRETQEQSTKMQQYQLLYNQLKGEYDQAFMIASPKQQAQGQG